MSNTKKPKIPNAFDQARSTGTIGGSGQPPAETEIAQRTTDADTHKDIYVDEQKATDFRGEGKIQQTMKMKRSLSIRVKVYAATHPPETISSVIEAALEEYLSKRENS